MATYSNEEIQQITAGFDELGFEVKNINQSDETRWTNDSVYKDSRQYTEDENLVFKYFAPIVIRSYENNNVYNVYVDKRKSSYKWNQDETLSYFSSYASKVLGVDENGNLFVNDDSNARFKNRWVVKLIEKGKKQLEGEDTIDFDEYKSTSEFAKFENFDDLEAPNYSNLFADDPQLSVVNPTFDINALTDSQLKKAQKKLDESVEKWKKLSSISSDELKTAMWTFDEIDEIYNVGITDDDKRAYFVYLQNKTRKKLKGDWDKKYGSSYPSEASYILRLMKSGALFYDPSAKFGERLQPKVIYQSGNIYKKIGRLKSQKEEIVQRFGEEIYQEHLNAINTIFLELDKNRLSVRSEDKTMRLFMSPISDLASEITIKQFYNPQDKTAIEENFKMYGALKDGELVIDPYLKSGEVISSEKTITQMLNRLKNKHKQNIDPYKNLSADELKSILRSQFSDYEFFEDKSVSESKFIDKSVITLKEGFIRWLKEAGEGVQASSVGIQWGTNIRNVANLRDFYLDALTKNPFGKESGGVDMFNRYKNEAKQLGERLFAQFLAEALIANDQIKVEIIWNSTFNAYVDPDLSKVPIGFTFRKYLDGDSLFNLTEFNLRAIRYYLTRGSAGLAYGVGVGKTFCSIFVIKQALDLGLATRPLIIVPNQVYQQFKYEVFRALGSDFNDSLPNSRTNGFFNGSEPQNNIKANNAVDGVNICTYNATELFVFDRKTIDPEWVQKNCLIIDSAPTLQEEKFVEGIVTKNDKFLFSAGIDEDKSEKIETIIESKTDSLDSDNSMTDDDFDMGDTFAKGGGVKEELPKIILNSPTTNYDMLIVDEVHNFNNLFTSVEMPTKEEQGGEKIARLKNPFKAIRESKGEASARATKLWFLARYVQKINKMGNTILLSATPFTNSPLQVYSLMSVLNWEYLDENDMGVIGSFFLNYAKIDYAEDFKTDLTITRRNKLIGWNNVISLQKYIYRYFDKSTREDEDKLVVRPNKWALPIKRLLVDGAVLDFAKENYISTTIRMSDLQQQVWSRVREYAKPKDSLPIEDLCSEEWQNTTKWGRYVPPTTSNDEDEVDVENAENLADGTEEGEKAKNSAKAIQCLQWGRQIANNPYVYKCSGFKENPTPEEYVEASPKMLYVMDCIRSVKEWHESQTEPQLKKVSGQVIYMNFQPMAFVMFRDYLVNNLGYKLAEIGIISGGSNLIGKKRVDNKQVVADAFMGRELINDEYVDLPEERRVKILIGSSAIKEGINLQKFASVLYNCYLDFNPTDRVQVEGRIWRQGNLFKNVRIVTPLMADSIDIFIFQKLEDKTERINQLWTRNGNLNELDTTAFDPSELKYELLSDPVQIAYLDVENRKERLNQEKIEKNEVLSQYITLEKVVEKADAIKYDGLTEWESDKHLHLYYNLSIIRPDLIELPLLNEDGYKKFAEAFLESEKMKNKNFSKADLKDYPNIYAFITKFKYEFYGDFQILYPNSAIQRSNQSSLFNYTIEDLINLMVQTLKEQKIAFPIGYSKNWRDLLPKKETPIVEGDEVEFDTKKGRKKGIADVVTNARGGNVLNAFYYMMCYQFTNNDTDRKTIIDAVTKLKLTELQKSDSFDNTNVFDEFDDKTKKQIASLLRYFYETNPNKIITDSSGEFTPNLRPLIIDSGDLEDLDIEEKNIVKVKKAGADKKVEPTKYPEPFTWNNSQRDEFILDILEYNLEVLFPKKQPINNADLDSINEIFGDKDRSKFLPYFNERFSTLSDILLSTSNSYQPNTLKDQIKRLGEKIRLNQTYFPKSWAELMSDWQDNTINGEGGLYNAYYSSIYDPKYAMILADYRNALEKKMMPLGISTLQEISNLLNEQRTSINAIDILIANLSKKEVFDEIVQEVIATQQRLASDEIRAGSSFKARANLFADSNSDYLGNTMLGFQEAPKKTENKIVEVVVEEVVSQVIEETLSPTQLITQQLIDSLEEAFEFESPREQKKTRRIIDDLREGMQFE
jgi:hypothetical protein